MLRYMSGWTMRFGALAGGVLALTAAMVVLAGVFAGESEAGKQRSTLSAVVNEFGVQQRGKGLVDSVRTSTGNYTVTFKQNVSACAYAAAIGGHQGFFANATGQADATNDDGNTRAVLVRTFDSAGGAANRDFHLLVIC